MFSYTTTTDYFIKIGEGITAVYCRLSEIKAFRNSPNGELKIYLKGGYQHSVPNVPAESLMKIIQSLNNK